MRICFTILVCLLLLGTSARFTISSSNGSNAAIVSQPAFSLGAANVTLPDMHSTPIVKVATAVNVKALAANAAIRKDVAIAVKQLAVILFRQSVGRLF